MSNETITVEQDKDLQLEHYQEILEKQKLVRSLRRNAEAKKDAAKSAKAALEEAQSELNELIEDGPNPQRKLGFEDDTTSEGDDAWRDFALCEKTDLPDSILKALKAAEIETVGQLTDYTSADKRLIDIKGIGQAKVEQIEEAMVKFWEEHAVDLDAEFEVVEDSQDGEVDFEEFEEESP